MLVLALKESVRSPREVLGADVEVRVPRSLSIVSVSMA
jgi:hypothetical protein